MKVLEFFSGIGGWRCALEKQSRGPHLGPGPSSFDVAASFDINTVSNEVYKHNFGEAPSPKCINSLTKKALDKYAAGMWCMSPPCQPYTRNNTSVKRDTNDHRSNAFLHLLQLLKEVHCRPQYILLENVVGFESSECCEKFLQTLSELQYSYVEFILTPTQFGTPNSRPRYYLLASLAACQSNKDTTAAVCSDSPLWQRVSGGAQSLFDQEKTVERTESERRREEGSRASILRHLPATIKSLLASLDSGGGSDGEPCSYESAPRRICEFLEPPSFDDAALLIPLSVLEQPSSWCFDIVTPEDTHTACFTKAYSRYARGTGSVLSTAGWVVPAETMLAKQSTCSGEVCPSKRPRIEGGRASHGEIIEKEGKDEASDAGPEARRGVGGVDTQQPHEKKCLSEQQISTLRLRYFSPNELLRLFGFPPLERFSFPPHVSRKKAYELIGNSLNVDVAAHLIAFLLDNTNIPVVSS